MEYDYYYDDGSGKKKKLTVGKILLYIIYAVILAVFSLIIFRIIIKEDPKFAKEFVWTEDAVKAYEDTDTSFKIWNQQIKSFSYEDENSKSGYTRVTYNTITHDGYFQVNNFMYIEATKELILTFRYNDASLKWLEQEYGISDADGEPYFLALYTSKGYITDYSYISSSRFTYEYRRVVFSGVDLTDEKTVDIYIYAMQGEVDLTDPIDTLPVYDSRIPREEYKLKKKDLPAKAWEPEKVPYVVTKE